MRPCDLLRRGAMGHYLMLLIGVSRQRTGEAMPTHDEGQVSL